MGQTLHSVGCRDSAGSLAALPGAHVLPHLCCTAVSVMWTCGWPWCARVGPGSVTWTCRCGRCEVDSTPSSCSACKSALHCWQQIKFLLPSIYRERGEQQPGAPRVAAGNGR